MWPVSNCLRTIIYLCPRPSDRVSLQKKKIHLVHSHSCSLPWKCKLTSKWSTSFTRFLSKKILKLTLKKKLGDRERDHYKISWSFCVLLINFPSAFVNFDKRYTRFCLFFQTLARSHYHRHRCCALKKISYWLLQLIFSAMTADSGTKQNQFKLFEVDPGWVKATLNSWSLVFKSSRSHKSC